MKVSFQSIEELQKVADLLAQSDFEQADIALSDPGTFTLRTTRPPEQQLQGAGLFRKGGSDWIPSCLRLRQVTALQIREELDVPPPERLFQIASSAGGFLLQLASAHGLRLELMVSRLDGELEDLN